MIVFLIWGNEKEGIYHIGYRRWGDVAVTGLHAASEGKS
jgi:hypothetical protein